MAMPRGRQDERKDKGGFVGGQLSGPRRKASAVAGRDLVTLDLDNIPAGGTDRVLKKLDSLGCGYCVYSTRKHIPAAPRLRVIFPPTNMSPWPGAWANMWEWSCATRPHLRRCG